MTFLTIALKIVPVLLTYMVLSENGRILISGLEDVKDRSEDKRLQFSKVKEHASASVSDGMSFDVSNHGINNEEDGDEDYEH